MAWEWSHSPQAYHAAERNLSDNSKKWLTEVHAEWHSLTAAEDVHGRDFDQGAYKPALAKAKTLTKDELCAYIWKRMASQRTCTNGGGHAWACPFGCSSHLVSFNRKTHPNE